MRPLPWPALLLAGCLAAPQASDAPVAVATLAELVDGAFPSGRDKQGAGGVLVLVHDVTVRKVRDEQDGDWHLNTSDATFGPFVMEVVPRDQDAVGKPPLGVRLAVRGVPFCDRAHEDAGFHGDTCWELHPVLGWAREP